MTTNYIDEVDSTLSIFSKSKNVNMVLEGNVIKYTASNPSTNNIVKDNKSRGNRFFSYTENNREASTLDFNVTLITGTQIQTLKDLFKDRVDDLEVIFVSGNSNKSSLNFSPCILKMEPMAPSRESNFETTLSFIGSYIEEKIVD
jgi:hypothetical protein